MDALLFSLAIAVGITPQLGFSSVVLRRPQTDFTIAAVANESTNSTSPTMTLAFSIIKELFPDQYG